MKKGVVIIFNEKTNELKFEFGSYCFVIEKFQAGKGSGGESIRVKHMNNSTGLMLIKKMVEQLL